MKVILKISTGQTAETRELVGILEFPNFILSKGHLYKLVERNPSEATYQWEECLHLSKDQIPIPNDQLMTQEQTDLLLSLCKPYLFDLLALLAKSAKYDDDPASDVAEGESYRFPLQVLEVISELSYTEKVSAMNEITYWLSSSAEKIAAKELSSDRLTTNDHQ